MEFIPYKANECFEHPYYQIPMELFFNKNYKDKLNSDSKILYGFLLNRLTLSAKNNWFDKEGNVFLIFTRKEVQELLNLSDKTVTKAFKQLSDCKLIYEKKQGSTKPNLIYVGKIEHDNNLIKVTRKNYDSRVGKSPSHDTENLRPNYNYNNYNYRGKSKSNFVNYEQRHYDNLNSLYANVNVKIKLIEKFKIKLIEFYQLYFNIYNQCRKLLKIKFNKNDTRINTRN